MKNIGLIITLMFAIVNVTACSTTNTDTESGAAINGTVGGSILMIGATQAIAGGTAAANTGPAIAISLSSDSHATCESSDVADVSTLKSAHSVVFEVVHGGTAVTTGIYNVIDPSDAQSVIAAETINDATCTDTGSNATAGTVTITALTATEVSGSYDLTFGSGDHVTGTFDNLSLCAAPSSSMGEPTTCS